MAGVTNNFNKQNKTAVPYAKVAEQISKVSASTAFNIKGGAKGLAEAAVIAARYGREIDDINNSAKQLLNFEESISNEIEAELLTGKDLNLEKLRYAALTGDAITQAKEQERLVKENFKSLKGNVLAQEAFAKSIGMTTEDVAKMVEQQEIEADILKKEGITGLQRHQAEMKAQAKQAKEAEATDRAFKSAIMQLKTALLPLIQKITPFFITMAESMASIGKILSGGVGKTLLAIIGGAGALYAGGKIIKGIGGLFDGGLGMGKGEMVGGDKPGTAKTGFLEKVLGLGRGKIGESAKNPMYVYVVNQGEGGNGGDGGETSGDLLEDILGKGKKGGTIGKGLTGRLFSKGGRDVLRKVGGGKLLKGIGKSLLSPKRLLKGAGGIGSLLGGVALDYAEEAQLQKAQQLKEQAQVAKTVKEKEELLKRAQKTKRVGQLAGVGSAALTGASIGATIGAPFFGIGAGAGAAIGAGIGGGYQLLKNYFSDSDEAEDFILRPGQKPLKFRKDDVIIGGTNVEGTKTSNTNTNKDALLKEFQEMKQILNAILHKEGTIMLNGTKMGTAMAVGSYKTQ